MQKNPLRSVASNIVVFAKKKQKIQEKNICSVLRGSAGVDNFALLGVHTAGSRLILGGF